MAPSPFEDEHTPLFTVGQVADMLAVKQAFLRRVDELQVVSPQRSAGGQLMPRCSRGIWRFFSQTRWLTTKATVTYRAPG